MDQPFKTFEEQRNILFNRMIVDNETISILMRYNYYSIVNFYKKRFILGKNSKGEDTYILNISFKHLKALHDFDKKLRILFFEYLTELEKFFKTVIAYYFSEVYGQIEKNPYLLPKNYNTGHENKNIHYISYLIKTLNNIKKDNEKIIIKHYNTTKDNIPFWIIVHYLTFGDISKLYFCLKTEIHDKISSHFQNLYKVEYNNLVAISPSFIKSFLSTASIFRNVTAHNERLYNYSSKRTINIKKSPVLTNNKRQKLFTIYEGLKFFLSRKEYDKLTENLKNIIIVLEEDLENVSNIISILIEMDFPVNLNK